MVILRQHVRNYYNSEAQNMIRSTFHRGIISETYKNSFLKPKSKEEKKIEGKKKHKEAEQRRRDRIKGQYATLSTVLPKLVKTDKASILGEAIRQVMELKKNVSELEAARGGSTEGIVFPSGADKLNLEPCNDEQSLVKATLSCEDRPGLMSAIESALREVNARVVKAEMITVGGRTRSVLWVQGLACGNEGMEMLKRTLKFVIQRPTSPGFHRLPRFTRYSYYHS
ncbi:hypothetical protein L6164_020520 [Bauhinia variegata]|uniref:Uncharacterized protein n=1 Tax=Bauhinia variegata TaxID=167791 RepID=A0ACB9MVA7_BAUVA|nr:hypothetical protein L6164_020520 [Bauhinia variegata]